ncbi:MAG: YlmC/YmxH family sporulation protein [Intestinibacillus sp.]
MEGCRIAELRLKEVINICDGARLGYVGDLEVDIMCGRVVALVVPGPCWFFGLFGRREDYVIPWDAIDKIGDDIILVRWESACPCRGKEKRRWFRS